jgi:hypothetical protein
MNEPTDNLEQWQSIKRVLAGRITECVPAGCYVEGADGDTILRIFEPGMTVRYNPVPGDYWIVYEDGYQSISPKGVFESGYVLLNEDKNEKGTHE